MASSTPNRFVRPVHIAVALAFSLGVGSTLAAKPTLDDVSFAYSERCDRSKTPDVNGRYQSFTFDCRLADWFVYGPIALGGEG